jgi:hypothetical protein
MFVFFLLILHLSSVEKDEKPTKGNEKPWAMQRKPL